MSVTYPPESSIGLTLDDVAHVLKAYKPSAWLDSKNIDIATHCFVLASKIKEYRSHFESILVEFPSSSNFKDPDLLKCTGMLKAEDIDTSYYVPTESLLECSNAIAKGNSVQEKCSSLKQQLSDISSYGAVNGFSFDYGGIAAMVSFDLPSNIAWHTWHINISEKDSNLDYGQFGFLIPYNHDPNYR